MSEIYIIGIAFSIVITLIGILYGIMRSDILANKNRIDKIHEDTDKRLDEIEKDIIAINPKRR